MFKLLVKKYSNFILIVNTVLNKFLTDFKKEIINSTVLFYLCYIITFDWVNLPIQFSVSFDEVLEVVYIC